MRGTGQRVLQYLHREFAIKVNNQKKECINLKCNLYRAPDKFQSAIEKEELKDRDKTNNQDRNNALLKNYLRNQSEEVIEDLYDELEKAQIEEHDKINPFTFKNDEFNDSNNNE